MLETIPQLRSADIPAVVGTAVEQLVGNTPLLHLRRVVHGLAPGVRV